LRGTVKRNKRPTLNDIAARAGVSVTAASLVLSDKAKERRLSDDVIARVRSAALDLDYSPNLLVQSMQQGRTDTLAFFNCFRKRSHDDTYMDSLETAIKQAVGNLGYDLLTHCVFNRTAEQTYRHVNGGRCDGLLLFAPHPDETLLPFLRASRLPVVILNGVDPEGALSHVREDAYNGLAQVANRLIALGHRRIAAFTNHPEGNPDADERVTMLRKFLDSRGASIPDRWVVSTDDDRYGDAEGALSFLMSEPDPPTALFCWHDRLGYQVLEHCDSMGIDVPGQLSVIGYDGIRWPAQTRHVLASVQVNITELARNAVTLVHELVEGKKVAPVAIDLPVTILSGTTLGRSPS
jgi:DNA-binding LacI/PurR family transcriptional regulator